MVVAFFGFTQCPDVCPTSLAELAEAMKKLGADADRVQVLLITQWIPSATRPISSNNT